MRCSACEHEMFTGMELVVMAPERSLIREIRSFYFDFASGGTWSGHLLYIAGNGHQRYLTTRGFTTPDDAAMDLYEQLEQRYPGLAS